MNFKETLQQINKIAKKYDMTVLVNLNTESELLEIKLISDDNNTITYIVENNDPYYSPTALCEIEEYPYHTAIDYYLTINDIVSLLKKNGYFHLDLDKRK